MTRKHARLIILRGAKIACGAAGGLSIYGGVVSLLAGAALMAPGAGDRFLAGALYLVVGVAIGAIQDMARELELIA